MDWSLTAAIAQQAGCSEDVTERVVRAILAAGCQITPPSATPPSPSDTPSRPKIGLWTAIIETSLASNPGPGGWACIIVAPDKTQRAIGGRLPLTNSNTIELSAILHAIRAVPPDQDLQIKASDNPAGWLWSGWKRKDPKVASLCEQIDTEMKTRSGLVRRLQRPTVSHDKSAAQAKRQALKQRDLAAAQMLNI